MTDVLSGPGPYSIGWNTTTATKGQHTLTAVAIDEVGTQARPASPLPQIIRCLSRCFPACPQVPSRFRCDHQLDHRSVLGLPGCLWFVKLLRVPEQPWQHACNFSRRHLVWPSLFDHLPISGYVARFLRIPWHFGRFHLHDDRQRTKPALSAPFRSNRGQRGNQWLGNHAGSGARRIYGNSCG